MQAIRLIRCLHSSNKVFAIAKPPEWVKKKSVVQKIESPPRPDGIFKYSDSERLPYEEINPYRVKIPEVYTEVEESREEWKYVEKLFPPLFIPDAKTKGPQASGWQPPSEKPPPLPYFIRRTKNHMLPVYVKDQNAGTRQFTCVRFVQGDIWALKDDLKQHLLKKTGLKWIAVQVHEPRCAIYFKGDFVDDLKQWLFDKGF